MGRKRQRLIVQADLTSEEDQAFLAWVKQKLRRRKLAEEIREGLRLQYQRSTGHSSVLYEPTRLGASDRSSSSQTQTERNASSQVANRLNTLIRGF